jgi:uncharacterized protein YaeQ
VAQTATIYTLAVELADVDRGVYETLNLKVARQPSETMEYMLCRLFAYCLEYTEGIAFTQGVAAGDEPAVLVRDLTGRITAWIEVGMPDADRLHRGSKLAGRAAVYTHRDVTNVLQQLVGKPIYNAAQIPIYALDRPLIARLAELLERRTALTISVTEQMLYIEVAGQTLIGAVTEHRLPGS